MNDKLFEEIFNQFASQIKELVRVEVEKQVSDRLGSKSSIHEEKMTSTDPLFELEELLNSFSDRGGVETKNVDELLKLLEDFSKAHETDKKPILDTRRLQDFMQDRPIRESDQVDFYIDALSSLRPIQKPDSIKSVDKPSGISFALELLKRYKTRLSK